MLLSCGRYTFGLLSFFEGLFEGRVAPFLNCRGQCVSICHNTSPHHSRIPTHVLGQHCLSGHLAQRRASPPNTGRSRAEIEPTMSLSDAVLLHTAPGAVTEMKWARHVSNVDQCLLSAREGALDLIDVRQPPAAAGSQWCTPTPPCTGAIWEAREHLGAAPQQW